MITRISSNHRSNGAATAREVRWCAPLMASVLTVCCVVCRPAKTPLKKTAPPTRPKPTPQNRSAKEPVQVFCRLRPLSNYADVVAVHRVATNNTLLRLSPPDKRNELFYKFKQVFSENTSQKEIFADIALPLVSDLVNGKNGMHLTLVSHIRPLFHTLF